jgi:hypothetical protein
VHDQLETAGTYWVVARAAGHPHPRPVWGIWRDSHLYLSIGTPITIRTLEVDPTVSVHLDSGTDVVIVEGVAAARSAEPDVVAAYDEKYSWKYDVDSLGLLTRVDPTMVLAWRTDGWAGTRGFTFSGRWTFHSTDTSD